MIDFERIENNKAALRLEYLLAKPFPHLCIDDFCEKDKNLLYSKFLLIPVRSETIFDNSLIGTLDFNFLYALSAIE